MVTTPVVVAAAAEIAAKAAAIVAAAGAAHIAHGFSFKPKAINSELLSALSGPPGALTVLLGAYRCAETTTRWARGCHERGVVVAKASVRPERALWVGVITAMALADATRKRTAANDHLPISRCASATSSKRWALWTLVAAVSGVGKAC